MVYLITLELVGPTNTADDMAKVVAGIKAQGPWARLSDSLWLVRAEAPTTTAILRDAIWAFMQKGDLLFVARLGGQWGSYNLQPAIVDWLKGAAF
jgi:hypothetical protein